MSEKIPHNCFKKNQYSFLDLCIYFSVRYLGDCNSGNSEEILSSDNFKNVSDAFEVLNNVAVDQIKDVGALHFRGIAAASLVVVIESKKIQGDLYFLLLFKKS